MIAAPRTAPRVLGLLLLASGACAPPQPSAPPAPPAPPAPAPRSSTPCDVAAELRAMVPKRLHEGRLHRAGRLIEKANRLCPATAMETWAAELSVSTALGKTAAARALVAMVEAHPGAPSEATAAAKAAKAWLARLGGPPSDKPSSRAREARAAADRADRAGKREEAIGLYEEAWEAWPRDGRALMRAGLLARELGRKADAQRLFDRATAALEAATGEAMTAEVPKARDGVGDIVWSRDGKAAALVRGDTIWILDTTSWRPHLRLRAGATPVVKAAFSPDGARITAVLRDAKVHVWDVASGASTRAFQAPSDDLNAAAFSPRGDRVAVAGGGGVVRIVDTAGGALIRAIGPAKPRSPSTAQVGREVIAVAFSPDGELLATGMSEGRVVRLWDVTTGTLRRELAELRVSEDASPGVQSVAFSPDGKRVTGGSVVWDATTGAPLHQLLETNPLVGGSVAFSPSGKHIAGDLVDKDAIMLWDAAGDPHRLLPGPLATFSFSPDGARLATTAEGMGIQLWDVATGVPVLRAGGRGAGEGCAAREEIACRVGPHVFPFEVCEERFSGPSVQAKILAGGPAVVDGDPEIEPAPGPSCPGAPDLTPPSFTAPPIPRRLACRPPALPKPQGVLALRDLEGPYRTNDQPKTRGFEQGTSTPLLLGLDAKLGRGAAVVIDQIEGAGVSCPKDVRGEVFDLQTGRVLSTIPLGEGGDCEALDKATARFAASLPKRGFTPARDLVDRVTQRYANDTYAPLGVLDAPLCGWMIHVQENMAARRFSIALVSPANDQRHVLGSFPFGDDCVAYDDHRRCAQRGEFRHPIVQEVALTPDRSRLYVSIGATHGGHNDPIRYHRASFALPRGVLVAP